MKVQLVGGGIIDLGTTAADATVGIIDFSRRETDDFGVTTVVQRGFSRRMSVRFALPIEAVDATQLQLADLRATAATWIADERFSWLTTFGFYKDFELDVAAGALGFCTLSVDSTSDTAVATDPGGDPAPDGGASTLKLLRPVFVTDGILSSSSVAEADHPAWSTTATYALGARVIMTATHRIYESLVAGNTGNDPTGGSGKWLEVGPTNRWAMFDEALGTSTSAAGAIAVTLNAGTVDGVALLDVAGATVRVQTTRYDVTLPVTKGAIVFPNMVAASGPVTVTIAGPGTVSVGTLLVGRIRALGVTEASPTAAITDFSRKEVDDFGEVTIVQRAWAKRMSAKALIRTDALDTVANRLAAVRGRPVLWIGQSGLDSLTVYGFFKDFSIEVGPNVSKLSLSIEGLSKAAKVEEVTAGVIPPGTQLGPGGPTVGDLVGSLEDLNLAIQDFAVVVSAGMLTPTLKAIIKQDLEAAKARLTDTQQRAGIYGISAADRAALAATGTAYVSFVEGLPNWSDPNATTPIDGEQYKTLRNAVYAAIAKMDGFIDLAIRLVDWKPPEATNVGSGVVTNNGGYSGSNPTETVDVIAGQAANAQQMQLKITLQPTGYARVGISTDPAAATGAASLAYGIEYAKVGNDWSLFFYRAGGRGAQIMGFNLDGTPNTTGIYNDGVQLDVQYVSEGASGDVGYLVNGTVVAHETVAAGIAAYAKAILGPGAAYSGWRWNNQESMISTRAVVSAAKSEVLIEASKGVVTPDAGATTALKSPQEYVAAYATIPAPGEWFTKTFPELKTSAALSLDTLPGETAKGRTILTGITIFHRAAFAGFPARVEIRVGQSTTDGLSTWSRDAAWGSELDPPNPPAWADVEWRRRFDTINPPVVGTTASDIVGTDGAPLTSNKIVTSEGTAKNTTNVANTLAYTIEAQVARIATVATVINAPADQVSPAAPAPVYLPRYSGGANVSPVSDWTFKKTDGVEAAQNNTPDDPARGQVQVTKLPYAVAFVQPASTYMGATVEDAARLTKRYPPIAYTGNQPFGSRTETFRGMSARSGYQAASNSFEVPSPISDSFMVDVQISIYCTTTAALPSEATISAKLQKVPKTTPGGAPNNELGAGASDLMTVPVVGKAADYIAGGVRTISVASISTRLEVTGLNSGSGAISNDVRIVLMSDNPYIEFAVAGIAIVSQSGVTIP